MITPVEQRLVDFVHKWVRDNVAVHFTVNLHSNESNDATPIIGINIIHRHADYQIAQATMGDRFDYLSQVITQINQEVYAAMMNDPHTKHLIEEEAGRYGVVSSIDIEYLEWRLDRLFNDPAVIAVAYNALAESAGT
ncbi:MAG: hypothetical protein NC114_06755 [Ruminococcus flavefaciens]|nr:hypothetical protein [Ruminococcus flavefaciens]